MKSGKYKWIIGILAAAAVLLGVFAWHAVWGIRDKGYEKEGVFVRTQDELFLPEEEMVYIQKCQGV